MMPNAPSTRPANTLLVIVSGPLRRDVVEWCEAQKPAHVVYLQIESRNDRDVLPASWQLLSLVDLGSTEELRQEYLAYLTSMATTPFGKGMTLETLLKRQDGYSLFWTDVGIRRSPTKGMFIKIKMIWLVKQAIARFQPTTILLDANDSRTQSILFRASFGHDCSIHFLPEHVTPTTFVINDRPKSIAKAHEYLQLFLSHRQRRHEYVQSRISQKPKSDSPAIVLTGFAPRHVRANAAGLPAVWYWSKLGEQLDAVAPVRKEYLLDLDQGDNWPLDENMTYLDDVTNLIASAPELHPQWLGHANAAKWRTLRKAQLRLIKLYYGAEQEQGFRDLFAFRGVDLANEWITELRHAVQLNVWWESEVDSIEEILKQIGNVRLVVVHLEFEPRGMAIIAACRRLSIRTVGVQHGTFYPLHTIYTPPARQLAASPSPDYYAVYGPYHRDVVSHYGSFPEERVWVCGASRFDGLANRGMQSSEVRQELNLPKDHLVLLVTTQDYWWFTAAVRDFVELLPERVTLVIKTFTHQLSSYRDIAAIRSCDRVHVYDNQFETLLLAADWVISGSSTTLLEATLAGIRIACLNYSTEPEYYPYVEEGVALPVRDRDGVQHLYDTVSDVQCGHDAWSTARHTFMQRHLGPAVAGQAGAEFAGRLMQLLMQSA